MRSAYLLDITRLASRLGHGPFTGIDRVELAYLGHLLTQSAPIFGLMRSRFGYVLLARAGCQALAEMAANPAPLPAARFGFGPAGIAALRPFAVARQPHFRLRHLLAALPKGALYLNVGHANLTAQGLGAMGRAGLTRAVMIHDTIPLDYPEFARIGSTKRFEAKLAATALHADIALHVSHDARQKTETHFAQIGRIPRGITAHLGLNLAAPVASPICPKRPYFIALGTVEPRKNLKLLLDIWAQMTDGPQLVIVGAKGWADQALFAQIDALQQAGRVIHAENLPDGAVVSLLQGAIALLFPSFAEGFGLPPLEAACLGTPVIAADLPVLRETCGQFAVYLDPQDVYSWKETIIDLARQWSAGQERRQGRDLPSWADHFNTVFTQIG